MSPEQAASTSTFRGKGCPTCNGSGYKGRVGLYEVMMMSPSLKEMVLDRASTADLKAKGIEEGMLTLRRDALRKMLLGDTTPEEVLRESAAD